jgi:hypothetical protein
MFPRRVQIREDEMEKSLCVLTTIFVTISLWGCGGGPAMEVQSQWSDSAVVLDGIANDWAKFPLEYSEEEKISLGVRNDSENIYFVLLSRDEQMVRKIQMAGVTLWFDTTGGKKKEFGIRYRGSVALMESLQKESGLPENVPPEQKARFEEMHSKMRGMITVLTKGKEVSMPENDPTGPAAASADQDGTFGYEFRIPIVANDSISHAIGASAGNEISVGLEVGGIDRQTREAMMREGPEGGGPPGGGMPGGGGRRMPGGGPGGARPGGGPRGDREQMMKKQEIWISIHLAQNPHSEVEED